MGKNMSAKLLAYLRKCDQGLPPQVVEESDSNAKPKREPTVPLGLSVLDILPSIANGHAVLVTRETWNAILQALSDGR